MDSDRVLELVARYLRGDSATELAAAFDVSETTVLAHLKRHGSPERAYRKLHGGLLEEAKQLYSAGASQLAIAHELGISRTAVRSGLLAAGIKLRDRLASQ